MEGSARPHLKEEECKEIYRTSSRCSPHDHDLLLLFQHPSSSSCSPAGSERSYRSNRGRGGGHEEEEEKDEQALVQQQPPIVTLAPSEQNYLPSSRSSSTTSTRRRMTTLFLPLLLAFILLSMNVLEQNDKISLDSSQLLVSKNRSFNTRSSSSRSGTTSSNNQEEEENQHQQHPQSKPTTTRTNCQRRCSSNQHNTRTIRPNILYYHDQGAGLGDRKKVIHGLAQLAGFLCAELVIPPPRLLLIPLHNHGRQVEPDVTWSDFYNLTYVLDGSTVVSTKTPEELGMRISWNDDVSSTRGGVYPLSSNRTSNQQDEDEEAVFNMSLPMYKNYLHLVSTNGKVLDDLKTVLHYSFQTQKNKDPGFVWEIHGVYYRSDLWTTELPLIIRNATSQTSGGRNHATTSSSYSNQTSTTFSSSISSTSSWNPPDINRFFRLHRNAFTQEERIRSFCSYTNTESTPSHVKLLQNRLIRRIEYYTQLAAASEKSVAVTATGAAALPGTLSNIRHHDTATAVSKNKNSSPEFQFQQEPALVQQQPQPQPSPIYVTLHVRRGDIVNQCDSSIPAMTKFLNCSLQDSEKLNRHIAILFMTDETSQGYREEIARIIDPFPHVSFLDVDNATRYIVKEAVEDGIIKRGLLNDNYFIYDVETAAMESFWLDQNNKNDKYVEDRERQQQDASSNLVLKKRKKTCPNCFPILQKITMMEEQQQQQQQEEEGSERNKNSLHLRRRRIMEQPQQEDEESSNEKNVLEQGSSREDDEETTGGMMKKIIVLSIYL